MPVIPFTDLPEEYRIAAYRHAINRVKMLMVNEKIVDSPDKVAVREVMVGAQTGIADFVDLTVKTAVVTGQEFWGQAAADITANALSSILSTNFKVPDDKVIVFFGFTDLTSNPDLVAIKFERGSDTLDIWQVQHCYKSKEEVGGMTFTTDPAGNLVPYCISYVQNDPVTIKMLFKTSSDKSVVLLALIGERFGDRISKT